MNHRKGALTRRDFDESLWQRAPRFDAPPIEHTSDFGVLMAGRTFRVPSRVQRRAPSKLKRVLGDVAFAFGLGVAFALVIYSSLPQWHK